MNSPMPGCFVCGRPTLHTRVVLNLFSEGERRPMCSTCQQEPPRHSPTDHGDCHEKRQTASAQTDLFRGNTY